MFHTAVKIALSPIGLLILAVAGIAAFTLGRRIAAHYGSKPILGIIFLIVVGIVCALTLPPDGRPIVDEPHWTWAHKALSSSAWLHSFIAMSSSTQKVANIALFVPLSLLAFLLTRKLTVAMTCGIVLSLAIEVIQSATGRSGDLNDFVCNAAGAMIGALAGFSLMLTTRYARSHERRTVARQAERSELGLKATTAG